MDSIEGLAPAIAIDQKTAAKNPRSTVGTMTEIYDYLRILYARAGIAHCPNCHKQLKAYSPTSAVQELLGPASRRNRDWCWAPLYMPRSDKSFALSSPNKLAEYAVHLQSMGFTRALIGTKIYRLDQLPKSIGKRGDDLPGH